MPRTRSIKPTFFQNEALSELEPLTRLLFIGLWGLADRSGRLEDRPRRIRIQVLPYDLLTDEEVDDMLGTLDRAGFIVRYRVESLRLIEITNFGKHQIPYHKEPVSKIPGPPSDRSPVNPEDVPRDSAVEDGDVRRLDRSLYCYTVIPDPLSLSPVLPSPRSAEIAKLENARDPPEQLRERESRSRFSLKECREYAETVPEIKAPGGFAKAIWRSGEEDDAIAAFQARGGAEESEHDRLRRIRSLRHSRPDN